MCPLNALNPTRQPNTMDIPVELIKWVVILGLIYYILDKTPIGTPIKDAMVKLMLLLWRYVGSRGVPPELAKEMNRIQKERAKKGRRESEC